ncbi:MAG: SIS domain-containing protein [Candidatus Magnetomorum sp.]|nr:SIS domain-containing protein [Candidatus Magnetomorum sp.]
MNWNKNIETLSQCLSDISFRTFEGVEISSDNGFSEWFQRTQIIRKSNNTIFFVGNGASASMASHMAADVAKNGRIRTQVFTDVSLITAIANDISYDEVFAEPVRLQLIENDMLIAISSSGNSTNVIRACEECRKKGGQVITLSAMKRDNALQSMGDINIYIPAQTYGWAESGHAAILHYWMDLIHSY